MSVPDDARSNSADRKTSHSADRGTTEGNRSKGLTSTDIITAAVDLTCDRGLAAWNMRLLARRLNVSATLIYHHYGNRQAVIAGVLDTVVAKLTTRRVSGAWRARAFAFAEEMRKILQSHPGTAYPLALRIHEQPSPHEIHIHVARVLAETGLVEEECYQIASHLVRTTCLVVAIEEHVATCSPDSSGHDSSPALFYDVLTLLLDGLAARLPTATRNTSNTISVDATK